MPYHQQCQFQAFVPLEKAHVLQTKLILFSLKYTVEFRFFDPPREMEIGLKNREFEKSKVASNHTCYRGIVL